jgi:hypothetical protein
MNEDFHSLFVDRPKKKEREKLCIVRDKGRVNQKLRKCLNKSYVYKFAGYCTWTAML